VKRLCEHIEQRNVTTIFWSEFFDILRGIKKLFKKHEYMLLGAKTHPERKTKRKKERKKQYRFPAIVLVLPLFKKIWKSQLQVPKKYDNFFYKGANPHIEILYIFSYTKMKTYGSEYSKLCILSKLQKNHICVAQN
jgi:hypothetical protein